MRSCTCCNPFDFWHVTHQQQKLYFQETWCLLSPGVIGFTYAQRDLLLKMALVYRRRICKCAQLLDTVNNWTGTGRCVNYITVLHWKNRLGEHQNSLEYVVHVTFLMFSQRYLENLQCLETTLSRFYLSVIWEFKLLTRWLPWIPEEEYGMENLTWRMLTPSRLTRIAVL